MHSVAEGCELAGTIQRICRRLSSVGLGIPDIGRIAGYRYPLSMFDDLDSYLILTFSA